MNYILKVIMNWETNTSKVMGLNSQRSDGPNEGS